MSSNVTLTYFDLRGRVEGSRLALEYAGVPYEMKTVSFEEFAELKPRLPFGQLPLYSDDQVRVAQSNTILRHIGRMNNLYGKSPAENAKIDEIIDGVEDALTAGMRVIFFSEKYKAGDRSELVEAFNKWCELFDKLLQEDYFVGKSLTVADIAVFNFLDNFARPLDALKNHAGLEAFRQRVAGEEKIKAYLASDRRPKITMHPRAGILCTPEECE